MLIRFIVLSLDLFSFTTRFADKQIIKLQETLDEIPEGGTPHTVSVLMHDNVDAGKPGDRVEVRNVFFSFYRKSWYLVLVSAKYECICFLLLQITGIYKAMSIRVGPTQWTVKSIFKVNDTDISLVIIVQFFICETASNLVLFFSWYAFFIQTYIDCLHIKKTDKSRLHVEDTTETDDSNANNSPEEDFLSDKVF
jgi:DNA replication licensing factor MCM4